MPDEQTQQPTGETPQLQPVYDHPDDIPESYRGLYTERGGRMRLNVPGVLLESEAAGLKSALDKERQRAETALKSLRAYGDATPERVRELEEEIASIRERQEHASSPNGGGKQTGDEAREALQRELRRERDQRKREREDYEKRLADLEKNWTAAQQREMQRRVDDALIAAARKAKVLPEYEEDVLLHGRSLYTVDEDGRVVPRPDAGLLDDQTPESFVDRLRERKPAYFPRIGGGGAYGSNGGAMPTKPLSQMSVGEKADLVAKIGEEKYTELAAREYGRR